MEAIYNGKRYHLLELSGVAKMAACNMVNIPGVSLGQWRPRIHWSNDMFPVSDGGPVQVSEKWLTVRAYIERESQNVFAVGHDYKHQFFHRAFMFDKCN